MTISALHSIPEFRHVAESHITYENEQLAASGGFPPPPVLERYDAGPKRVNLKRKLSKELSTRSAMKTVTKFYTSTNQNFIHLVVNQFINDLPEKRPLPPALQTAQERRTVRVHNQDSEIEMFTQIINSYL